MVRAGLAFNSAGDLFEADFNSGNIYEFTTGAESKAPLPPGCMTLIGLAFNSAGNLFEADYGSGNIYEFTPVWQQRKHLCLRVELS